MRIFAFIVFFFLSVSLYSQTGCCPYIVSITVIPSNPTLNDSIKIVTATSTPNLGHRILYYSSMQQDTIYLFGCFYSGMLTQPSLFYDTTEIGMLPQGTYYINYFAAESSLLTTCSIVDSNSFTKSFDVSVSSNINSVNESKIDIYPNPCNNSLRFISNKLLSDFKIEIVNCFGQICFSKTFAEERVVDLTSFASGIYLVCISNEEERYLYKIFRQ